MRLRQLLEKDSEQYKQIKRQLEQLDSEQRKAFVKLLKVTSVVEPGQISHSDGKKYEWDGSRWKGVSTTNSPNPGSDRHYQMFVSNITRETLDIYREAQRRNLIQELRKNYVKNKHGMAGQEEEEDGNKKKKFRRFNNVVGDMQRATGRQGPQQYGERD